MGTVKTDNKQFISTPFYYGWLVLFISAMGMFFSGPGQTYNVSIFIDSYIEHFQWSRTLVSSIYSTATLMAGLSLFFIGSLIDRYGPKKVMMVVITILAAACFWNSFVTNAVMLFIGFYLIRLFGQGSMTLLPSTIVPRWFVKKRGRATGFLTIGGLVSGASIPPISMWLVSSYGWPIAWRFWGIMLLCFFLPIVYFFLHNKPQDIGLEADGATGQSKKNHQDNSKLNATIVSKQALATDKSWTVSEAMRTYAFWIVLFSIAVVAFTNTALVFHFFSILRERGVDTMQTAFLLSLFPIVGFFTAVWSGFLLEKYRVQYIYAFGFAIKVVAMILLYFSNNLTTVIVFVVIWGLFEGIAMSCYNIVWPNFFGLEHLGKIRSVATTAMVLASAFGPLPMGLAYDIFGGYQEAIIMVGLFPLMAMFLLLFVKQPG